MAEQEFTKPFACGSYRVTKFAVHKYHGILPK
jgi:hypothetical protein